MTEEQKSAPVRRDDWSKWITILIALMTLQFGGLTWVVGQIISKANQADVNELRNSLVSAETRAGDRDAELRRFLEAIDQRTAKTEANMAWIMAALTSGGHAPPVKMPP